MECYFELIAKPRMHTGGGGGSNMYAYWVCAALETPIFSPKFPFRSISFSQIPYKSGPEHHRFTFFADFAVLETIIFERGLAAGQSASQTRPGSSGDSKRLKLGPEPRIFTLKTAQARSGAQHFHA